MAFDVDGVMTDGQLYFTGDGQESKAFHTLDGQGVKLLQMMGITPAIITGRHSGAVAVRAAGLGIEQVFQGVGDKRACLEELLTRLGLSWRESGYMGDDLIDLAALAACGFSAAPANAHAYVRARVDLVATAQGGAGAVREVCDFILAAQGKLDAALAVCTGVSPGVSLWDST
jgi:3-deoxy-D-manno-octulosonate 8-phosphate phosphatase (KDO 8-P phosphatase)